MAALPRTYDACRHRCMRQQSRLDLSGFDSEAADLDLPVIAAEKFHRSVSPTPHAVSCPVQACLGIRGERIRDEAAAGFIGPPHVAERDAVAAEIELPGDFERHRFSPVIEDIRRRVGDRLADGDGDGVSRNIGHLVPGREGGHFRRTVDVEEPRRWPLGQDGPNGDGIYRFPSEQNLAQGLEDSRYLPGDEIEERGRQKQRGHLLGPQSLCEAGWREHGRLIEHHQSRSVQQRSPDFESGGIEGRVRNVCDHVTRPQSHVVRRQHQAQDGAVGDGDAFRLTRRARCIHDAGSSQRSRHRFDRSRPLENVHVDGNHGKTSPTDDALSGRTDHQTDPCVGENACPPPCRVRRVEGHVGGSSLQDRQHGHDRLGRPGELDAHGTFRPRAECGQPRREQIG